VFYQSALKSLLSSLAIIGVPCIFKLVIEHTMSSAEYIFQSDLENSVRIQAKGSNAFDLIKLGFQIIKEKPMPRAFNAANQLLLPMMRECRVDILLKASCEEIRWLVESIQDKLGRRELDRKQSWMRKSVCYSGIFLHYNIEALEIIFARLGIEHVNTSHGSLVQAFAHEPDPPKNALTKPILAQCIKSRKVS
jgi:hypothetical protein